MIRNVSGCDFGSPSFAASRVSGTDGQDSTAGACTVGLDEQMTIVLNVQFCKS